jgi:hypothetical protein
MHQQQQCAADHSSASDADGVNTLLGTVQDAVAVRQQQQQQQ